MDRGLSLAATGRASVLSVSEVSRIECGLVARVSVHDLARLHAVVGLELSLKSYPSGQPIRDAAHVALLEDFRKGLHSSLHWSIQVPLPIPGDRRTWDALIRGNEWRYGVEAETAPRDSQSVARRMQLKQHGRVDGVLLVLRRTVQTRRFVSEAGEFLRNAFPVDGTRPSSCSAPEWTPAATRSSFCRRDLRPGGDNLARLLPRQQRRAREPIRARYGR
jgi:transcriptional regulator with XRE-family HTH domain